ncbi:MAG: hypothetical protein K5644_05865 [Lachnospiraceae bacterium]|nr:hypothetical protein [Lachnospiraceae bacterium]
MKTGLNVKKKVMVLAAVSIMMVATLGGCACGKESKFVGTWEGKYDYEAAFKEEYGEAQSPDEAKILGEWEFEGDKRNHLRFRNDHNAMLTDKGSLTLYNTPWELSIDNGQETVILRKNVSDIPIYAKLKYDASSNKLISEGTYLAETGEEVDLNGFDHNGFNHSDFKWGSWFKKGSEFTYKTIADNNNSEVRDTMILNSNKTGTYTDKTKYGQNTYEITWGMSSNNDSNTIVVKDATGFFSCRLVYDTEKGIMHSDKLFFEKKN